MHSRWVTINLIVAFLITCKAWTTFNLKPLQQQIGFCSPTTTLHLQPTSSQHPSTIEKIHGSWNSSKFGFSQCWGRRPLILRNAFDCDSLPLSWEEVFDLACDESNQDYGDDDVPASRLIDHEPGTLDSYSVEFGPFPTEKLKERLFPNPTTERASTLVVNDVDRFIRDVSDWMDENFNFIPRWRRDDAQVSLATVNGGIGPHVDNYDVFLIQASGSREWKVGLEEISVKDEFASLVPELDIRILNLTKVNIETETIEVHAGDCLYLPPRFMHFGTSTSNDCLTLSVGCRSPSASDLVSRIAEAMGMSTATSAIRRYADTNIFKFPDKELSSWTKSSMKELVKLAIADYLEDDDAWDSLVGKVVTEPNRPVFDYPIALAEIDDQWKNDLGCWGDANEALDAVAKGLGVLRRAEGISFAWSQPKPGTYRLYAHGRLFQIVESNPMVALLCCRLANGPMLDQNTFKELQINESASIRKFLIELVQEGFLYAEGYENEI